MSAATSLRPLVGYLQQLAGQAAQAEASDRQLLERFARQRDEEAFRTLVRRHGPLVLGVCRRALGHRQDAEDCFQATFLVLARKAGAVRWHESVAGWLHQAATRLAAEVRVREARRRRRERQAAESRSGGDGADLRELGAALDEELRRLPERCRAPLLLCYLQGRTREQAAVELGLPLRTLERRLRDARELLHARLLRRGLTLSAALLACGIAQEASAVVPPDLCAATVRAATGAGTVPPQVAALAARAVRVLLLDRLRRAAVVLLTVGLLAAGMGLAARLTPAVPAAPPIGQPPAQVEAPKPAAPAMKLQEAGTAAAVDEGLGWLVRRQTKEGGWKLDAATPNDVAATAFGVLPLLGAADATHLGAARRGLKALVAMQKGDGGFAGGMYAQALATWALGDGLRRTGDATLKPPAQRAVDYIVRAQHIAGGWRYAPGQPGDTSVTSWMVLALKRGQDAGLAVPAVVFKKASAYFDTVTADGGATYGYVGPGQGTPAMTAAGLLSRRLLGWGPRQAAVLKGAAWLQARPPGPGQSNVYYYHYATRLMEGVGGTEWEFWEPRMVRTLLARQQHGGADGGSWPPAGDAFGQAGGRLMVTSLALLTLQVCGRLDAPAAGAARELKNGEAAGYWDDLAGDDLVRVRRAMLALAAAPGQAVPLLRERLRPAPAPDAKVLARLIADLAADEFNTRDTAFEELRKLGTPAGPALRKALKGAVPLEQRRRLEQLLEAVEQQELPGRLRRLRGVQVLELAGTAEARQVLRALAEGEPDAAPAARAALERLGAKAAP